MSPEHGLPPELASFERQLRQQSLQACQVDRDQLMYEAGWAAAEASRKTSRLWPASSAVLAASVFVLAALLVRSPEESPAVAVAEVAPSQAEEKPIETSVVSYPQRFTSRWTLRSPLLVMRDRALRMEFDEPVSFAGPVSFVEIDDDYVPKAVTARELMQDFLEETS